MPWERDSWSRKFAGISVTNPLVMVATRFRHDQIERRQVVLTH
jgi:hypothetical protein